MKLTKPYLKRLIKETAAEYVWGVKNPSRVANQYKISNLGLKKIIKEEIKNILNQL